MQEAVDFMTALASFLILIKSYAISFIALLIRRLKIPERLVPKVFDVIGASHQIFHILGATAMVLLYSGYMQLYENGSIRYCAHVPIHNT